MSPLEPLRPRFARLNRRSRPYPRMEPLEERRLLSAVVAEELTVNLAQSMGASRQWAFAGLTSPGEGTGVAGMNAIEGSLAPEQLVNHTFVLTASYVPITLVSKIPGMMNNIGSHANVQLGPTYAQNSKNNSYKIVTPDGVVQSSGWWDYTSGSGVLTITFHDPALPSYGLAQILACVFNDDGISGTFNFAPSGYGSFVLVPGSGPDTTPPAPSAWQYGVNGTQGFNFQISYYDAGGVSLNSLDAGKVAVTAPNGSVLAVTLANKVVSGDGLTATALYQVTAPGGSLDYQDNGDYTIHVQAGAVKDASGNANAAADVGVMTLALPLPDRIINGPVIAQSVITTNGPGEAARVKVLDSTGQLIQSIAPFGGFANGMTVASGDINADGTPDVIVAAGPGGATNIRVLDGKTGLPVDGPLGSFLAYPGVGGSAADPGSSFYTGAFQGKINLAAGDINGDGHDDIIVSIAANGPPHLKVFSGADGSELMSLLVYPGSDDVNDPAYFGNAFQGGVRVASGDVTGDGRDDILTGAGPGAGPHVKVFDGVSRQVVSSYFAYDPGYSGGVRVAAGDYNGDGVADIITAAGIGVGPHVKAIDAATGNALASFWAYDTSLTSGLWIASTDIDGDGKAEILTLPDAGGSPNVRIFKGGDGSAPAVLHSFNAFDAADTSGGRIAVPSGGGTQGFSGNQSLYAAVGDSTIEKFDSNGVATVFATGGNVDHPRGMAFDRAGNLYVANQWTNTIEKIDSNGTGTVFATGGNLNAPWDVTFDQAGNLYVANYSGLNIEKFDSSGAGTIFASGSDAKWVSGLAFGPN